MPTRMVREAGSTPGHRREVGREAGLPVSPSMAKERPGAIAVVLGMAGGWAGRWGVQSCGRLPAGRGQPPAHMASPARSLSLYCRQAELFQALLRWLVIQAWARRASRGGGTGHRAPRGAVIVGRAVPRWGAGGSDIALPLQQLH